MPIHAEKVAALPMAEGLQRVAGLGRLGVGGSRSATSVCRLREEGAAKIRFPMTGDGALEATLINTAGGLTGGDRMRWELEAASNAALVASSPAAERAYRSIDDDARVDIHLTIGEGGSLSWLPQETILYEGSALRRTISASVAPTARLLMMEALVFGRKAMGEAVHRIRFSESWRVHSGQTLIHAEESRIVGDATAILAGAGTGGGCSAFATVLLVTRDAMRLVADARSALGGSDATHGVSGQDCGPTGKLLARLAANDGRRLRAALQLLLPVLSDRAALPRIWAC